MIVKGSKMKVTEMMEMNEFERCCDAGAELMEALKEILRRNGLDAGNAAPVISIAAAGVMRISAVDPDDFYSVVEMSGQMWQDAPGEGLEGVTFDPPHRHPDFIPPRPAIQN